MPGVQCGEEFTGCHCSVLIGCCNDVVVKKLLASAVSARLMVGSAVPGDVLLGSPDYCLSVYLIGFINIGCCWSWESLNSCFNLLFKGLPICLTKVPSPYWFFLHRQDRRWCFYQLWAVLISFEMVQNIPSRNSNCF